MAINYLPFARKEQVIVPARKADRVQTGGFVVSDLARMATGGTRRAIVHDITIQQDYDTAYSLTPGLIRARIGIDGRTYMTEDLYDYRVYCDQQLPLWSIWDWSCGKRTPYRLYPGQRMTVLMARSANHTQCVGNSYPLAAMFNGMKVAHGSPVGTKEGEPILLYGMKVPTCNEASVADELMLIDSARFQCPRDNPVDLYSVTLAEWSPTTVNWPIYILDGNDRPIWDNRMYSQIINNIVSPISMGFGGLLLDPDETVRVDLENGDPNNPDDMNVDIMYRGVLEVDDGR
jgi:hypothetical protein